MAKQVPPTEQQRFEALRIGQRLEWAREAKGVTRTQLAQAAGVATAMVRNMENGTRVPSVFLAMSLCHILEISPQYLLWGSLQGVAGELSAKLARAHPELRTGAPLSHEDTPNPGKARRSRQNTDSVSATAA